MKYAGWIVALIVVGTQVVAQGAREGGRSDLTWRELKQVQDQEHSEFLRAQKESLAQVLSTQTAETEHLRSMVNESANEERRKDLAMHHSEERNRLADTQASERKAYRH